MIKDIDDTYPIKDVEDGLLPDSLFEIPQLPKKLVYRGTLPDKALTFLTIVGSRRYSPYGEHACRHLIAGLAGYPVVIVSGLAMGIDSIAHTSAIEHKIPTIAFPGSGLDKEVIYPAENKKLAEKILESGGALISEFKNDQRGAQWTFPQRNRLMAGIARATLLVECTDKSGTLITARLALDYNHDLLVIPGPIFAEGSKGTNGLLRHGATPITSVDDLLEALGFTKTENPTQRTLELLDCSPLEKRVLELLRDNSLSRDEIVDKLGLSVSEANSTLSIMEIKCLIVERFGELWRN
jgi:DNA processing protein